MIQPDIAQLLEDIVELDGWPRTKAYQQLHEFCSDAHTLTEVRAMLQVERRKARDCMLGVLQDSGASDYDVMLIGNILEQAGDKSAVAPLAAAIEQRGFHQGFLRALVELDPDTAMGIVLRFVSDEHEGKVVVSFMQKILKNVPGAISTAHLWALSRLRNLSQAEYEYGGTDEDRGSYVSGHRPVRTDLVNSLAREELKKRGKIKWWRFW